MSLISNIDEIKNNDVDGKNDEKENQLDRLKKYCSQLIFNKNIDQNKILETSQDIISLNSQETSQYVYKKCSNCIVIMKFLPDTKTNENRENVKNSSYAKFRANRLLVRSQVVTIIDIDKLKEIGEIENSYSIIKINYQTGQIVIPNRFDEDIDKICASGIHYFKTIDYAQQCILL